MTGKLIVIDGTDGSGKATQRQLLYEALIKAGLPVKTIEFPRYEENIYGKMVGRLLTGEFGGLKQLDPYLSSLPFAGDRMLAKPLLDEWLAQGKIVIADRYVSASQGFQAAKLPEAKRQIYLDWLEELEYGSSGLPREDLVIYLYVDPDIAYKNILQKAPRKYIEGKPRDIHENDLEYLEETTKVFKSLAKQKSHWVIIDCMKDGKMKAKEDIHREILKILKDKNLLDST